MTFTPEIERELCELLWARCDGTIRPEQIERLDELVCTNEQCRKFYVLYMHLHAGLCWDRACTGLTDSLSRVAAGGGSPRIGGTPGFDPPPMPGRTKKSVDSSATGGSLFRLAPVWGGLALLAMLMIVGVFLREHSSAPLQRTLATADAPEFIAKVSGTNGCVWDVGPDRRLPVLGSHLHVGQRIRLKEGVAQITFHVGATLLLQGPATFDVESYTRAFLHSGKLTASVSHRARGFTIQTPSAKVIDLGTQFGVDAEAGGDTEVHVFRGVVELEPGSGESPASRQRLTGGQATRINAAGENLPGTQLAAGDFPMVLWEESQTTRQSGESALPGDKLAIDFEQSGGKLNSAQWYVSGDMNATRLRTRYPSQGTWLLSTDGAAGHPDAVLNVKDSVIDGNTSIAWGPFFTVNDEVPEGAVISLDIAGGGFPWSENVVNGPAGVALWDVAARDFARGPSSNVVFVFSSVNRFLPKREEISLAGLEGKTLGIVVVDRRSIAYAVRPAF